ncbi:AAA family ATPase [Bacillus sp. FJAT-29790]|uniref:AAA family ATPase n=1 Tax=Bacillus sp. FJAT-29790 TaxID=1895002 RepID=UPI001C212379|nr:AAA family ATPase [Bacillus sp. FJAT-29790]MBU8880624.1 AAA family ATPase [Bacillus sp. FJAT-29790]
MLKIKQLYIRGINGVDELYLSFNSGFNFISGANGVGKTTILDCIASSFNRHSKNVRTNVKHNYGFWNITVEKGNYSHFEEFIVDKFVENTNKKRFDNTIRSKEIINFSINRTSHNKIYYGNQFDYIQSWFYKNYYAESRLTEKQYYNLKIAQKCFTMLDPNIYFSKVVVRKENDSTKNNRFRSVPTFADIYVESTHGEIPLEYLSSGYRSCLTILLGVIKQTEVTSSINDIHSYEGVILIDELDLHLHPEWQAKLIDILRWLVPNAQIIATTHSPHIIQVANPNEIIPLGYTNKGQVSIRNVASNEYGFQGWSVEEILIDVMGLRDTHTEVYHETLNAFDKSLSSFDSRNAKILYNQIDKMLHPENHLRKVLKIQMASLERINND